MDHLEVSPPAASRRLSLLRTIKENGALLKGLNIVDGHVTYAAVAEAFGIRYEDPRAFIN